MTKSLIPNPGIGKTSSGLQLQDATPSYCGTVCTRAHCWLLWNNGWENSTLKNCLNGRGGRCGSAAKKHYSAESILLLADVVTMLAALLLKTHKMRFCPSRRPTRCRGAANSSQTHKNGFEGTNA